MDKLGIAEFEEVLMELISPMVLNRNYISMHKDFWNNLVFKMFENYRFASMDIPVSFYAKNIDIFFGLLFEFKPAVEKPEDIITF